MTDHDHVPIPGPQGPPGPEGPPGPPGDKGKNGNGVTEAQLLQLKLEAGDRIVTLHGPVVRGMQRFKFWVGVVLVFLTIGNAISLLSIRDQASKARERIVREAQENCQTRNRTELNRRASTRAVLGGVTGVRKALEHHKDIRDVAAAYLELERVYATVNRTNVDTPLPTCQ